MSSMTESAAALAADEVTPAERDVAHLYLNQTQNAILGAIKGLSQAQWQFKPAPDCWSICEIVEHITFVTDRVGGPMREALAQAPPPPAGRDLTYIDDLVISRFPSRLVKFPSPPAAHPSGDRFPTPSAAREPVLKSFATLAAFLDTTPDLRDHALDAAPLKALTHGAHTVMDGYQWILAATAHAERHTKQILEVRADENFPAH